MELNAVLFKLIVNAFPLDVLLFPVIINMVSYNQNNQIKAPHVIFTGVIYMKTLAILCISSLKHFEIDWTNLNRGVMIKNPVIP